MKRLNTTRPITPNYDQAEVSHVIGVLLLLILMLVGIWVLL